MRGLAEEVRGFWDACTRVAGGPVPGGQLKIVDLYEVLNWLRRALVSVRSLDLEVFAAAFPDQYRRLRDGDRRGVVVRGLVAPRNQAVHHPEVVDPDLARAVGPIGEGFVIFPRWRLRKDLPPGMFERRGRFTRSYAEAYDAEVAGRSIIDTLMDAFAFFDDHAPEITMRDSEGALVGFPLPPLPFAEPAGYRRLAPSWPTESDRNIALRDELTGTLPGGTERVVLGFLRTGDGVVLTGQTRVTAGRTHAFVECALQVAHDIEAGYRYVVEGSNSFPDTGGGPLREDLTVSDGTHLVDVGLVDEVSDDERPWAGWWDLCLGDVNFYWSMRRPD